MLISISIVSGEFAVEEEEEEDDNDNNNNMSPDKQTAAGHLGAVCVARVQPQ